MASTGIAASVHTLRDPDGQLISHGDRLFRAVRESAAFVRLDLPARAAFKAAMDRGHLARTWRPADGEIPQAVTEKRAARTVLYEHERLPFVSYPREWSPLMLCDAALLTLEMQQLALTEGLVLKDATPANVLFKGSKPVFVDTLSFDERPPGDYLWRARHQFDACFLLPLLLHREANIPISWTLSDFVHGVSHEQARDILGIQCWFKPRLIGSVAIPAKLSRHASTMGATHAAHRRMENDARARFTLEHQARSLHRQVMKLREHLASGVSRWAEYTSNRAHYSQQELEQKRVFVRECLGIAAPREVLDLGANTGEFSELAARAGARVVAIDIDEQSVSGIAARAQAGGLDIHPLVGNMTFPTPAEGWKNRESRSLLDRLAQGSDLVLVLALMHHLRITGGIPFVEIVDLVASLTRRHALFELVPPADPMFAAMARGREPLYTDCEPDHALAAIAARFTELRRLSLPNGRSLLLLEKR